jgi:hypothetical protein
VLQAANRYWLIQSNPLVGSQDIDAYPATAPWGPFETSDSIVLYHNPDVGLDAAHDYRIMYEARAESALSTAGTLVISYNVNSPGVTAGCVQMSAYTNTVLLPRFVTVPMTVFGAARSGGQNVPATTGVAGAPPYPHIAARDPSQWYDGWEYATGCPPVPAVAGLRARPQPGGVQVSWQDVGPGVSYQVYLLPPGVIDFELKTTTGKDSVTLSGLSAGAWLVKIVPVSTRHSTGPSAQAEFIVH